MTGTELKELAEQLEVNPYYLGYALATGAATIDEAFARDGGNHHYIIWNNKLWTEQATREGLTREWVANANGAIERHIALCAEQVTASIASPLDITEQAPPDGNLRSPLDIQGSEAPAARNASSFFRDITQQAAVLISVALIVGLVVNVHQITSAILVW